MGLRGNAVGTVTGLVLADVHRFMLRVTDVTEHSKPTTFTCSNTTTTNFNLIP